MKKKKIFSIILLITGLLGVIMSLHYNGKEQFLYYTQLSNFFLFIINAIYLFFLYYKKGQVPIIVKRLKYIATCLTTITFIVVVFLLAPYYKALGWMLFHRELIFHHTLNPLLALYIFLFIDDYKPTMKDTKLTLIPTLIYAYILILLNYFMYYKGPYPFLMVHDNPWYMSICWAITIIGSSYIIALVLKIIKNKLKNR